jgi:hypothetical protein
MSAADEEREDGGAAHLQTLHRQLYDSALDRCLLWVNPAQGDPFEGDALVQERKVRVPISHPRFDLKYAPYLAPLDLSRSADAEVFKASVRMAWDAWTLPSLLALRGQPIGGWVVTDVAPAALAQYWASHCHLHVAGGLHKLLRFHDPSVREWLWPALDTAQQRRLLGPARLLIGIDRQQNLMQQSQRAQAESEPAPAQPLNLKLTEPQWAQVEDYAVLHSAWLAWCEEQPRNRASLDSAGGWRKGLFAALQQATQFGIVDPQDRELFARHALQLGADFYTHEKLNTVWGKTRAGEFYGGAVEEVSGLPVDELQTYLQSV